MNLLTTSQPRVTILMIARERHALTEAAIECVVANTSMPYRFIYTDGQTPEWLWQRLEQRSAEWGLELVRHDEPLWPHQLRNHVLGSITTDYLVCIDNDVMVSPGWLEPLVSCADETNAGIVGPLYMWGDGNKLSVIHMAAGYIKKVTTPEGIIELQEHLFENVNLDIVRHKLTRSECDFMEFHCMLIRTEVLKKIGGFDERLLNAHKHIDISLAIKQQGYKVYLEPTSRVDFLHYAPYRLEDLAVYRWRYSVAAVETSIQAYCEKWQVLDHPKAFDLLRKHLKKLAAEIDPILATFLGSTACHTPMQKSELKQTRSDLLDQAAEAGYTTQELKQLSDAYRLAQALTDGGYRPCGRPFINHLIGVSSVLMHYGFKIETLLAGMLHTFYSHGIRHPNGVQAAVTATEHMLGGVGSPVESRVRAYTKLRAKGLDAPLDFPYTHLNILDAEVILIALATEIEVRLSGEIAYSGKNNVLPATFENLVMDICKNLGVSGLAQTLIESKKLPSVTQELLTNIPASYRLQADKLRATPMSNNLLIST
ncbi:MAG: glycosyltransferase [Methylophilales bacterium]|nr:glycosyltransferase [Methylophilales bacterium]